jgi:hypothetical protein
MRDVEAREQAALTTIGISHDATRTGIGHDVTRTIAVH